MVLDFDVNEYCKKLRMEQSPPYKCPVVDCARSYKSLCGIQYHLQNYDHDNPTANTPTPITPKQKKGSRSRVSVPIPLSPTREALTFDEAQKIVQFDIDGKIMRVNVSDEIPVMTSEEMEAGGFECGPEIVTEAPIKLPEPSFKELENYNICDAPPRPNAYIRFIEKSAEELDGEVEYDVDEEDTAWLSIMNEKREAQGLSAVSVDTLELLMDRLEKESYFQAAATGQPNSNVVVDDDAVCCICMDGECQNTNVILFCDMCNLAVHQDCYGVPYIPEGQWLCRRCLQSPSRAVDCVLCPNHGGAFKQTDRGHWAHVVCALWIPEVRFANTVFLEPIDSIETIPPARWKLTCYVCKQRGVGACIQCHKTNCYAAFHVTCAQQAGLYMKMDTVKDTGDAQPVLVQKTAYCDAHTPADGGEARREESRQRMKQARKILAKKRSTVPVILIPTIPPERIQEIGQLVTVAKKSQFIQRLIAYWTLKRQFRNGVPLLRRLQSAQGGPRDCSGTQNVDTLEMCRQLKYWQCLRQDLERARLLCELVRKREKLKAELTKQKERCLNVQLKPMEASMRRLIDLIAAKDVNEVFLEPVDLSEVPDYSSVVTNPMDLSTMRMKLDNGMYPNLAAMEKDFDLMISNCLAYNNRDTMFYRAAVKMREQGGALFKQAKQEFEEAGFTQDETFHPPVTTEEQLAAEIDKDLQSLEELTAAEVIDKLESLLAKTQLLKNSVARTKRLKQIRAELTKIKKSTTMVTDSSQSDFDVEDLNKSSPQVSSTSPAGVNRRTAVLFTRKAQAALKKPETVTKPELSRNQRRRAGRPRRSENQNSDDPKKNVPDSFRVYRGRHLPSGDEESDSGTSLSTCYSLDLSDIETFGCSTDSESSQSQNEAGTSSSGKTKEAASGGDSNAAPTDESTAEKPDLKPLQLVWAKCRGYPWYPALIIDPEMPKGYVHRGVPIPAPPQDVLALSSNYTEHVFLVLFFDAKRTWQWLPADKLEILGLDTEKDQAKVSEPRKPTDRKAVRKAYQHALTHQCQVAEPPGPDAIM